MTELITRYSGGPRPTWRFASSHAGMFIGRHFTKIVILALAAGVFIYASTKQTSRLRGGMPRQFIDATNASGPQGATEERIARAYWDCAVIHIQWKYGYGQYLPEEPPREFAISAQDYGPVAADPVVRARYWRKLREAWYVPGNWTKTYDLDFDWITNSVRSADDWLNKLLPGPVNGQ